MRKFQTNIILFSLLAFAGASGLMSCNDDVEVTEKLESFQAVSKDEDAGTWVPVSFQNDEFAVPAPAEAGSAEYIAELNAIKALQSNLTSEQRKTIEYWNGGGSLRWNQLLREMVARYNLPPAPKEDGTYPAPDANNPFNYPLFPFANPPYSCRSYSYFSAAQYDALRAAWHYKFLYNRSSPSKNDPSIQALMGNTDIPSYPSEEGVMSAVAESILKLLFPADSASIFQHAQDQRNAALWSGKASSSDIAAGYDLGKAAAAKFVARAKADGMKNAIGNPALWQALIDSAEAKGEVAWSSLETPKRPPMLPFYGNVMCWNVSPADFVKERPAPPYPTNSVEMRAAVDEVKKYAKEVDRDRIAIVHKWADGVGTYTPPGHWNDIAAEYLIDAKWSEVRTARAIALLNMAIHDAGVACWDTKYFYFNPRPTQMDSEIKTSTGIPNFPAYTSGHSTFSGAAGEVLAYLFPSQAAYFREQAVEASFSRLYGGIHYRQDCVEGLEHGIRISNYTINFAKADGAN